MRELRAEVEIEASPERVWEVLADFSAYPEWNPFVRSAEGELAPGARLKVRLQPPGSIGMTFRPTVLSVEPGREFRWLGHLMVPGLLDGEHYFRVEPMDDGRTRLVRSELFRGLLVPVVLRMVGRGTLNGFQRMNRALKERAEHAVAPS